jgi:hypothetical protein
MQQTSYQRLLAERREILKAAGLPEEVQKDLTTQAIIDYLSALLRAAAAQLNEGGAGGLDPEPAVAPATKSVGAAVAKALLTGNRFTNPNLIEASDFGATVAKGKEAESTDSFALTDRIRKRREQDGMPGGPR